MQNNENSKIRIAVSGVGGGVGQSVIKALQGTNYEVVCLDGEPLGAGLYAGSKSYIIPYASNPDYLERVLDICKAEDCKLFFPGLDAELPILSRSVDRFTEIGTQVIVSRPEVVDLSDNKSLTALQLAEAGVSVPQTIDMDDQAVDTPPLPFPFVLKVKIGGARSQGLHVIKNEDDWQSIKSLKHDFGNYVAQEYIDGDEYTCGTVNLDNECKGVIVMRRILRDGDTYKCFSVKDPVIETEVRKVVEAIKPFGACNVQLRVRDGKPYIFEINARCSGTTAARALCGFNEPKMIADFLLAAEEPSYEIIEQSILRYWKELVVPNSQIETIRDEGVLSQDSPLSL